MVNAELASSLEDCVRDVIEIDLLRPHWMGQAACRGEGFDAWFSPNEVGEEADAARQVCAGCRHGLWGGLSPSERTALNRRRGQQATAKARPRYYAYGR